MLDTTLENARQLLQTPLDDLISQANAVRAESIGDNLQLCGILNARSGRCIEDCKFCSQSSRYHTNAPVYSLMSRRDIVAAARERKAIGAERFGIVTSGNCLTNDELKEIAEAISEIVEDVQMKVCASLGALDKEQLTALKNAGLSRYHHNIETSRSFYPHIVTTHTFDERVATIKAAKEVGLEVCSGGIIGMGETWRDRIDMALTLNELQVDSVPINILIPIEGTPLENIERISVEDCIRTICIFRVILRDKTIKIAAGREAILKREQLKAFAAGANGMIIGGYLTVKGQAIEADNALIERIREEWTR
jgi:biotin synthase